MDRIIAISAYLREEYNCKHCGQVLEAAEVVIEKVTLGSNKIQWSASCPECHSFIRWMPQSVVGRVWWRGSVHEIAKLETGLLQWMLRVDYGKSKKVQKDIKKVLFERIDKTDVMDIRTNTKEDRLLDEKRNLEIVEKEITEKYNLAQEDVVMNSHGWKHHQVELSHGRMKALWRIITKTRKELDKIEKLLKDEKQT